MINFGILIITVPLLNLAEISSILILLSNLTVFTHFPFFKLDTISLALSSSANSLMYASKVASMVISLSPASMLISSFGIPGTATFK